MNYDYVLRYHAIISNGDNQKNIWELPYQMFLSHMNHVKENNLNVWITFDDGILCSNDPYRMALGVGKRVTTFVLSDLIGKTSAQAHSSLVARRQKYMDLEQLEHLSDVGVEIGSHGRTHVDFPALTDQALWNEVFGSKAYLEKYFGEVTTLCYPSGFYNKKIQKVVRQAGYKQAVACEDGDGTEFAISRVGMYNKPFEDCVKEFLEGERARHRVGRN